MLSFVFRSPRYTNLNRTAEVFPLLGFHQEAEYLVILSSSLVPLIITQSYAIPRSQSHHIKIIILGVP